jgi:hypothetical protein
MRWGVALFSSAVAFAAAGLFPVPAYSADLPTKAPAMAGCPQAVDGINGKLAGYGGSSADKGLYGAQGALAIPLGCEFGTQIDGSAASFDDRFLGTIAGHLFWRNPAKGLIGLYGSYTDWNQGGGVHASHVGGEGEYYFGQWTLQGVAGVEFGNNTTVVTGGVTQTYNVQTRFFDQVNLGYYLQDNFRVYVGHRYLYGKNALAVGGEYGLPMSHGIMAALFAEGRIGESDNRGIWGGVRFYFGQKDKTLIRRHREDDPTDWQDGIGISGTGNTGSATPPAACTNGSTNPPACNNHL